MSVSVHAVRSLPAAADIAVTLVTAEAVKAGIDGIAPRQLELAGFEGKADQVHVWPDSDRSRALVGLGPESEADHRAYRRAGAALARSCSRYGRAGVELPADPTAGTRRALAEGVVLGAYGYTALKSDPTEAKLRRVDVAGGAGARARGEIEQGAAVAAGQCLARDLVNEPGGSLTAPALAARTAEIGRAAGLGVKVWTSAEIKRRKLGGLLGVNRGSTNPPRFVELAHTPEGEAKGSLALVGKGITFDAGGLNIKTTSGMLTMKMDMAGAAAVIGAMSVIGALAPPTAVRAYLPMTDNMLGGDATRPGDVLKIRNGKTIEVVNTDAEGMLTMKMDMAGAAAVIGAMSVIGALAPPTAVRAYLPMTDNMLGGDATRPGDVLKIRNGKTIEVVNTDAEGRLILADALSLASEARPDAIVDLATLTGACMVALGPRIAGLMGNNQDWVDQIRAAAAAAGERVWPLPLPRDYESQFESNVADMKNLGGPHGGAITAGLILERFVADGIAWAHLDIAGPAYSDAEHAENPKGGTGFGVRTLVELAAGFTKPAPAPAPSRVF